MGLASHGPSKGDAIARDEWNIGVVAQTVADIVERGIVKPVRWVEPDAWRILADPFCYTRMDGRTVILAENMNHWEGRGAIWSAVLPLNGSLRITDFKPFAASRVHLSYPFRMQDRGTAYLTMESFESGRLHLWREDPDGFTHVKVILDRPVVDPTFYYHAGLWWLFCTFFDDLPNERLHLFFSESLTGEWRPHPLNPVRSDITAARPAGALFETMDRRLIRPAQNCQETYGAGVALNQITELSPTAFHEVTLRTLDPVEPYSDGIHTLASAGRFTVIDGKRWHRHAAADVARKVIAKGFKMQRHILRRSSTVRFFDKPLIRRIDHLDKMDVRGV